MIIAVYAHFPFGERALLCDSARLRKHTNNSSGIEQYSGKHTLSSACRVAAGRERVKAWQGMASRASSREVEPYLVKGLAVVHTNDGANHLRHDDHVAQVRAHGVRLLARHRLPLRLAQLLNERQRLALQAALEPAARTTGTSASATRSSFIGASGLRFAPPWSPPAREIALTRPRTTMHRSLNLAQPLQSSQGLALQAQPDRAILHKSLHCANTASSRLCRNSALQQAL